MIGITKSLKSTEIFYKIGKKWKQRYCVLSKTTKVVAMLRLYIFKSKTDYLDAVKNRDESSFESAIVERDNVYGFIAGTHMDNRQWVTRLICESTVHCLSFLSETENDEWTKTLQDHLRDTYFHVRLLRADKRSKLHPGQEGCLHIQQHRICFVSEPSTSPVTHPKLLLKWSIQEVLAYGPLDASELEAISGKTSSANGGVSISSETSVRFALEGVPQCPGGSGLFIFACAKTDELYNKVHETISKQLPDSNLNSESIYDNQTDCPPRFFSRQDSTTSGYSTCNSSASFAHKSRQNMYPKTHIDRSIFENEEWTSQQETEYQIRQEAARFINRSSSSHVPISPVSGDSRDYAPYSPSHSSHFNLGQPTNQEVVMRDSGQHQHDRPRIESNVGYHEYIKMQHSSELLDSVSLSDQKSSLGEKSKCTTPNNRSRHHTGVTFNFDNQVLSPEEEINKDKPWMEPFLTMERKQSAPPSTADQLIIHQNAQQYLTNQKPDKPSSTKRTARSPFSRSYSLNSKRDKSRRDSSEKRGGFFHRLLRRQTSKDEQNGPIHGVTSHESDKWLPLETVNQTTDAVDSNRGRISIRSESRDVSNPVAYYETGQVKPLPYNSEYVPMNSAAQPATPSERSEHSPNNENVPPPDLELSQSAYSREYVNIPDSQSDIVLPKILEAPPHSHSLLARRRMRGKGCDLTPLSPILDGTDREERQSEGHTLSQSMPQSKLQTFREGAATVEPRRTRNPSFSSTTGGHAPISNLSSSLLTNESMPTTPGSTADPMISARRVHPAHLTTPEPGSKSKGPMVTIPWNVFSNDSSPRSPPSDRPLSSACDLDYLSGRRVWQPKDPSTNQPLSVHPVDEGQETWSQLQPRRRAASERPPVSSIDENCGKLPCTNCNHLFYQPYPCLFEKSSPTENFGQPLLGFCSHSFCHQMHCTVNEPDYSTVSSQKPRSGGEYLDKRKVRGGVMSPKSPDELDSNPLNSGFKMAPTRSVSSPVHRQSFTQHYMNIPAGGFEPNNSVPIDQALNLLNEINSHQYMNLSPLDSPPAVASPNNRQSYVNLQDVITTNIDPNSLPLEMRDPKINYAPVDMRASSSPGASTKQRPESLTKPATPQLAYATLLMPPKSTGSPSSSHSHSRPSLTASSSSYNNNSSLTASSKTGSESPLNYAMIDFKQTEVLSQLHSDYEPTENIRSSPTMDAGESLSTFSSLSHKRKPKTLKNIIKV